MIYNFNIIENNSDFDEAIQHQAILLYFTSDSCNVADSIAPKLLKMMNDNFSKINLYYSSLEHIPEVAAKSGVFTAPTILVFFNQQEIIRKSRLFSLDELKNSIDRLYKIMFN